MKKLFYIAALIILNACQIEDDNAPSPDDSFIKYLGIIADQEAKDIEPIYAADGITLEGFVIFGTQKLDESPFTDYYVVRTDAIGNIVAARSYNPFRIVPGDFDGDGNNDQLSGNEIAGQIEVLPNGGFTLIGTTSVTDNTLGLSEFRFITGITIDSDLNPIDSLEKFSSTNVTNDPRSLIGNDIIRLSDGSFFIVGAVETATGDFNYYYSRVGTSDDTDFEQLEFPGTSSDDVLVRAYESENNTIALFGYSALSGNLGERGTNVTYTVINFLGNLDGGSGSFGITDIDDEGVIRPFDDVLHDVIQKPGGYMAVGASTIDERQYSFFMDIDNTGISTRKDTLGSEFGSELTTQALGITASNTNDFVVVGSYTNYRVGEDQRGEEAMFMRINQLGEKVTGFESNYGLSDGDDVAADVITLSDGKIVIAATIDFGGGIRMIGLIKLNDTGELDP